MPSPLGHAVAGLIVGIALAPQRHVAVQSPFHPRRSLAGFASSLPRRYVAWCATAACLPDIDFAWGRHSMETHSVGFMLLVAATVFAWERSGRLALVCALAVGTHILCDWLGSDDFQPLGVMALWPFSRDFFFAHAYVFGTISRRYWLPGFVAHNLWSVVRELAILLPLAALACWLSLRRARQHSR